VNNGPPGYTRDMDREELGADEVESQEAALLPHREAMSLIPTTGDWAGMEGLAAAGSSADAGTAIPPGGDPAGPAADTSLAGTDAEASGGGSESVTDADRDETFTSSETATADS
jgi:hypothetical protein